MPQDIDLYATIGQLQKQAGIDFQSPERHIDRALQLRIANEYEQAIFEFGLVGEERHARRNRAERSSLDQDDLRPRLISGRWDRRGGQ